MPKYKLIYFNLRGRAEVTRLLFAQAGVEYEDHRVQGPDWPELKKTMPTGKLPVLEIDGVKLPQSQAIARFVAREFDLAGSTNLEQAQCDAVLETLADIGNCVLPFYMEKDESKKAEMKNEIFNDKVKPKLTHLEKMVNGSDVFVGNTVTVADIAFFARSDFLKVLTDDDPLKEYPRLTALKENVGKQPKIAEWVAKRPETSM